MRALLLVLILTLPVFSFYAGEVIVQVEKTWDLSANETITELLLNGTFLLENDFQQMLQKNVSEGAEFQTIGDTTYVVFEADEFIGDKTITATATVHAAYPLEIASNPPFAPSQANATPLTQYDDPISSIATSISSEKETELEVVSALTDWTYRYLEYDLSYWGQSAPASAVYHEPKAVCVGYTHLLISMLKSLGFETRFVSGYAFADEWQAHAWAEVKIGDSWIPLDPTFRETGALDARHIASSYSEDQSEVFDTLIARGAGFTFNSTVSVQTSQKEQFEEVLFVHSVLYDDDLKVIIYNPTNSHVTPTYELSLPEYLLPRDTRILTIAPEEFETRNYHLSTGELEPGYAHTIPYRVVMQGTTLNEEHIIVKGTLENGEPTEKYELPKDEAETCPLISAAIFLILFSFCIRLPQVQE